MRLIFLFLCVAFLASCNGGQLPTDNISFGAAFAHVAASFSYWAWVIVAGLAAGVIIYRMVRNYRTSQEWTAGHSVILFFVMALLLFTILYRPTEVAANTTNEQAARGVYIGY